VIKQVINDDGGTAVAGGFTMTINGVTATGGNSFPGAESPGTTKAVSLGSYSVTESGPSGYNQSQSAGCSGTIAANETKTCTIINNDGPPPVGGIVDIRVDTSPRPVAEERTDGSGLPTAAIAITTAALIAAAAALYRWRRYLR